MEASSQFSLRILFVMLGSCAVSFAILGRPANPTPLVLAAGCVPVFWGGVGCVMIGSTLETLGEDWLVPGVVTSVLGSLVCVLSAFTAVFYLGLLGLCSLTGTGLRL